MVLSTLRSAAGGGGFLRTGINETITLRMVAAAAGVSASTASRALAGKAKSYRISEQTERQVRQTAETLGFRHSHVARSLRSRRTGLLGVVVPDISNAFFAAIAREVTLWAESGGYSVLISDSRESISVERRMVEQLLDRRVEALVVCPVGTESSHLESVHRSGLPIVLADRCFPGTSLIQVTSDHYGGAVDITRLLTAKGHRSIGVLQGLPGTLPNEERLTGIRDAVTEAGFHWDSALVAGNHFTEASGFESAFRLLSDHPEITAIVALSTPNALGAMRAAPRVGRNIPQDLSLVTFDDSPFSDFARVPLTTAAQDVAELGRIAAQSLDCRLQSDAAISQKLCRIKMRLIERNSVVEALS